MACAVLQARPLLGELHGNNAVRVANGAAAAFAVHPAFGTPGETVTLSGADFSGTTDVQVHGVSATFTQNSTRNLSAVVPATTSGKVTVVAGLGTLVHRPRDPCIAG